MKFPSIVQAGLELAILRPQPAACCNARHSPPRLSRGTLFLLVTYTDIHLPPQLFLNAQCGGIVYTDAVMQLSPPSISRTWQLAKLRLCCSAAAPDNPAPFCLCGFGCSMELSSRIGLSFVAGPGYKRSSVGFLGHVRDAVCQPRQSGCPGLLPSQPLPRTQGSCLPMPGASFLYCGFSLNVTTHKVFPAQPTRAASPLSACASRSCFLCSSSQPTVLGLAIAWHLSRRRVPERQGPLLACARLHPQLLAAHLAHARFLSQSPPVSVKNYKNAVA